MAEIIAHIGFNWVVIDIEHGSINIKTAQTIVKAISATKIEHIDAVNHIDEILSAVGIDAFLNGPMSLAEGG